MDEDNELLKGHKFSDELFYELSMRPYFLGSSEVIFTGNFLFESSDCLPLLGSLLMCTEGGRGRLGFLAEFDRVGEAEQLRDLLVTVDLKKSFHITFL